MFFVQDDDTKCGWDENRWNADSDPHILSDTVKVTRMKLNGVHFFEPSLYGIGSETMIEVVVNIKYEEECERVHDQWLTIRAIHDELTAQHESRGPYHQLWESYH